MMSSTEEQGFDGAEIASEQAAAWFARLANDRVSESDCSEFRRWRASSPVNAEAYDLIASVWEGTRRFSDEPSILEMRVAALAEMPSRRVSGRVFAIAATLALMVVTTLTLSLTGMDWMTSATEGAQVERIAEAADATPASEQEEAKAPLGLDERTLSANAAFQSAYSTRVGEMAEFALPDGSSISLNTGSEVRVDFTAGERNLTLIKGEAMFTVAKDADRPFIVATGNNRVVALGTIFTVRRNGEEAQVTLIEGRVRVDRGSRADNPASAQLVAGEQLRILPDRSFAISKAEIARATSWRDGRLVFDQTPLREVLDEFNRYTNEKHVLGDQRLGRLLVNGTFRIKSSEHFAATLEAGFPVTVRARSGGKVFEVSAAQEFDEQPVTLDN